MSLAWIPNAITVLRILLVFPTAWLLWHGDYVNALLLTAIAGASDALDGYLARQFRWTSQLGAMLDPVADKLLVAVLFLVFVLKGHIPIWVAVIVLARDAIIFLGALIYRMRFGAIELSPTFVSKANTAMQIVTLLLLLVALSEFNVMSSIAVELIDPYCFYLLAILGISSGLDYVVTWSRRAWHEARQD